MKIFMTGGTGFVGTTLTKRLTQKGHRVTLLTRDTSKNRHLPKGASYLEANPTEQGTWQERVGEHEVIINLAGASIFRRWTESSKNAIWNSRILTTQNLVAALSARKCRETLFLSTSAVGYYGFYGDEELDEESQPGDDFLASLSKAWESSALNAEESGVNVVLLRFGIVLGKNGGALRQMVPIFNWCMGSPLGSGKQWFSWIHEEDLANIYLYLLERKDISGPINCMAPNPVRNEEMTKILGEVLGSPTFMPAVPGFIIKIIMGEFGSILLKGRRVLPKRILNMGFCFRFPEMREAFQDLLS
ncbi:MAG: TIGR01777 family oxidoreductase [Desulfatiglandales bacterium]|jgi:hypothetical protein|nr:TIGR01777 family oxidoreductase [Desulfatiglandales bacterium]